MDKTYIDEHDIGGKYLRGELVPEECTAFEEYLMEDELLLEELELDSVISRHSARAFDEIGKKQKNKVWAGIFQIVGGMAAGALLMMFVPQLITTDKTMLDNFGIAQIEYFDETRAMDSGSGVDRTIHLENGAHNLVLVIDTGGISQQEYDIEIRTGGEDGQLISTKRNLTASRSGELIIDMPVERIPDETYLITLYKSGSPKPTRKHSVHIIRNIH